MNNKNTMAADERDASSPISKVSDIFSKIFDKKERDPDALRSSALMLLLAFIVGVFGGLGSIVFKAIISFVHNLSYYGSFGLFYDTSVHAPASPLGIFIILVPVVGGLIVTWIVKTLAPEARGHGVPEVLNAIYYRDGKISPMIVVAKAMASAISIGTGGSVGREGPIVQIGSAFGSVLGQIVNMPTRQRVTLIAAGAAAGIAATFNAPIGGLAFAVELLLVSISARTVTLVAVATVTATYIGHLYEGLLPSFNVPPLVLHENDLTRFYSLMLCVPLGVIVGLVAMVFIRSIYFAEDWFNGRFKNEYLRHSLGMLAIGCALYLFMEMSGHYYIGGVGYATIIDVLTGALSNPAFLALLFIGKLLATDITIGSGASGGVFSPALFLGATLGACYGNLVANMFPGLELAPAIFTIAAMAGMVGGTTGAVLTAVIMTFEQTRDYSVILPIILTVSLAYVVRMKVCPESIYTLKLMRRGAHVPQGLQAAISQRSPAHKIMSTDFQVIAIEKFEEWLELHRPGNDARYTIVAEREEIIGLVRDDLLYLLRDETPEQIIDKNFFTVVEKTTWPILMRGLRIKDTEIALVFKKDNLFVASNIAGVITPRELAKHAASSAELME